MELNLDQENALKIAVQRYKDREPYTYIAGFAGSGKSTLVKFIISALHLSPDVDVCYATYTGKASLVLKNKGCPNTCTVHKLLYRAVMKNDGSYIFIKKLQLDHPYKMIVIDEVSMINEEMWQILLSHKVHVLALGDPAQLPPVAGTNDIGKPHAFLTQIMRQDQDSEIIRLSMLIREGKPLPLIQGKQVQVISQKDFVDGMYEWADMIICATNQKRRQINQIVRNKLGFTQPTVMNGEKIVCLHNEWDMTTKSEDILVNGMVGYAHNILTLSMPMPYDKYCKNRIVLNFQPDYYLDQEMNDWNTFYKIPVDPKIFTEGIPLIDKSNFSRIPRKLHPKQFDYAYAMSCWKTQGSEYDKVLLFEETFPFGETHAQYLYTGITRAKEKLIVVRKD